MKSELLKLGEAISEFVAEKNEAYGDSIATSVEIMTTLFPDGIPPDKYEDVLLVIRVLDKISRIARGDKSAFSETPWVDISGYAMRGALKDGWSKDGTGQTKESMVEDQDHIRIWPVEDTGYRSSLLRRSRGVRAGGRFES